MKKHFIIALWLLISSFGYGQDTIKKQIILDTLPNNLIFVELFGNSFYFGSVNYERIILHKQFFYLSGRIGTGFGYLFDTELLSIPIGLNGIFHIYHQLYFEVGAGTTLFYYNQKQSDSGIWENGHYVALTGTAGIRLKSPGGFVFRASFTPIFNLKNSLNISDVITGFGFSFGGCFGK